MIQARSLILCALSSVALAPAGGAGAAQRPEPVAAAALTGSARPERPSVRKITAWSMTVRWRRLAGRSAYVVYGNGAKLKRTTATQVKLTQLRCGRRYRISVAVVDAEGRRSRRSPAATATTGSCPTFAQLLNADMTARSEVVPHGMDGIPFGLKPRIGAGVNAGGARAFTAWGQLYECRSGNPEPAARVEIRDIRAWIKSRRTGAWTLVQSSPGVDGGAYREDFANDDSKVADVLKLAGNGTSATAGKGYNFHFWPQGDRVAINPGDVGGVITLVRARLTPGAAAARACYVLSMGADYWTSPGAGWGSNKDVGIGRFKRVTSAWRAFTMSTTHQGVLPTPLPASAQELH